MISVTSAPCSIIFTVRGSDAEVIDDVGRALQDDKREVGDLLLLRLTSHMPFGPWQYPTIIMSLCLLRTTSGCLLRCLWCSGWVYRIRYKDKVI